MGMKQNVADHLTSGAIFALSPVLKFVARYRSSMPRVQSMCDSIGAQIRSVHYYEPSYRESDLPLDTKAPRTLSAIDFNEAGQLKLLAQLDYGEELKRIPIEKAGPTRFGYRNDMCEEGVAELLYSMIRHLRPKRIVEIGSGNSTLISRLAIDANAAEAPYAPEHICIEPYEMPWLESVGVKVLRERVEHVDLDLFRTLEAGDILIIDSSHAVRPWGDVLRELLEILPVLAPGVYVSIDDIFTPFDYPDNWLRVERRMWTEQYMVEAFLSYNSDFEVVCAAMWLKLHHPAELLRVCPMLAPNPDKKPGVLWLRRTGSATP